MALSAAFALGAFAKRFAVITCGADGESAPRSTRRHAGRAKIKGARHGNATDSYTGAVPDRSLAPCQRSVPEPFQISVNVNLVVLNPVVRDRKGQFASDLHEGDFKVYEDGVRQSIKLFRHEDIPVTVGLVVDHSGSMKPKLDGRDYRGADVRPVQPAGRSDVRRQLQRESQRWLCRMPPESATAPKHWRAPSPIPPPPARRRFTTRPPWHSRPDSGNCRQAVCRKKKY